MSKNFIKGLELNKGYYLDIVEPIIKSNFPRLKYSAGLIGYGSDVLGFDTPISMDHNWGPRLILFLEKSEIKEYKDVLDDLFKKELPYEYKGFPINFTEPDNDGVQKMEKINEGKVNHLIQITTIKDFLYKYLGIKDIQNIQLIDWLKFPEQGLIEVTEGKIFYDGLKKLKKIRNYFNFYPEDVLKLKLASLWNYIAKEEAFIGRNADLEQAMGVKLISSRIVNTLMKICLYLERKYIPYSKWFSKSFEKLECYDFLGNLFKDILYCENKDEIEGLICNAYKKVILLQNKLKLTENIKINIDNYYGRPYKVIFTDKITDKLLGSIENNELKNINLDSISLIENSEGIDMTDNSKLLDKIFG